MHDVSRLSLDPRDLTTQPETEAGPIPIPISTTPESVHKPRQSAGFLRVPGDTHPELFRNINRKTLHPLGPESLSSPIYMEWGSCPIGVPGVHSAYFAYATPACHFYERPAVFFRCGFFEGEHQPRDHDREEDVVPNCREELKVGLKKRVRTRVNQFRRLLHPCENEGQDEDQMR